MKGCFVSPGGGESSCCPLWGHASLYPHINTPLMECKEVCGFRGPWATASTAGTRCFCTDACICVFVLGDGGVASGFYERLCVCARHDNRWEACSLALSSGTCAVSNTPRDPRMIGSQGPLKKKKISTVPPPLTVKEDWRTAAVTHYSQHRALQRDRGEEGAEMLSCQLGVKGRSCRPDLERNKPMCPAVGVPKHFDGEVEIYMLRCNVCQS